MFKNYIKTAWRNLVKNKTHSFINITGLSVGIAVAILIGLWIWNEISYDKHNKNYDHIAQVLQNQTLNDNIATWGGVPYPLAEELRKEYGSNFKHVILSSGAYDQIIKTDEKAISKRGAYMEPGAPDMLDLQILEGANSGLTDPTSVLISKSAAEAIFGDANPLDKIIEIDSKATVNIAGVYKDIPDNSAFAGIDFIGPWQLKLAMDKWIEEMDDPWGNNSFQVFVQLAENVDLANVSSQIAEVKLNNIRREQLSSNPRLFLQPMSKWHLYSEFKGGINTGGRITYVWLFGMIGVFILLLACINFMNLSTAKSERRAREVGVRKAIGSLKTQLIHQFLIESFLVVFLALILSLLVAEISLPLFNSLADKQLSIPWSNIFFWLMMVGSALFLGLIAGSYPSFYLSELNTVKILKGSFRAGRYASIPRKVLVVVQFTVSVILIIATLIVFRQIHFAENRPLGYNHAGLISVTMHSADIHNHFDTVRNTLKNSGAITEMAESANPLTQVWRTNGGFYWEGKEANQTVMFPTCGVSYEYGKTIGWEIKEGRDFSKDFPSDSSAFILNETAVKYMGLEDPVGKTIRWSDGVAFKVIGVVKDMIMESPYASIRPTFYFLNRNVPPIVNLRLNPSVSAGTALDTIKKVFEEFSPGQPFEYQFVDTEYAQKFSDEKRLGNLATIFAVLAIFISCLGLFGLTTFVAEQRTKEIGVRKVLGASNLALWRLLSGEFIMLVIISLFIATPVAYYLMHQWLQNYQYSTNLSWQIFAATGIGLLLITFLTISFQLIKVALMNPVKSLRSE